MDACPVTESADVAIVSQMALQTVPVAGSWRPRDVSVTIAMDGIAVADQPRSRLGFSRT